MREEGESGTKKRSFHLTCFDIAQRREAPREERTAAPDSSSRSPTPSGGSTSFPTYNGDLSISVEWNEMISPERTLGVKISAIRLASIGDVTRVWGLLKQQVYDQMEREDGEPDEREAEGEDKPGRLGEDS